MIDEWTDLTPLICDECGTVVLWYPGTPGNGTDLKVTTMIYDDIQRALDAHVCGGAQDADR